MGDSDGIEGRKKKRLQPLLFPTVLLRPHPLISKAVKAGKPVADRVAEFDRLQVIPPVAVPYGQGAWLEAGICPCLDPA